MMVRMDSGERAAVEEQLAVMELVEVAMARRDEVFEIVETSEDADEAQARIRDLFVVNDPYVSRAVLDIQVSRWTRDNRKRITDRVEELRRLLRD
jgi:DNA gyrase/topoisomerase IV subunit A